MVKAAGKVAAVVAAVVVVASCADPGAEPAGARGPEEGSVEVFRGGPEEVAAGRPVAAVAMSQAGYETAWQRYGMSSSPPPLPDDAVALLASFDAPGGCRPLLDPPELREDGTVNVSSPGLVAVTADGSPRPELGTAPRGGADTLGCTDSLELWTAVFHVPRGGFPEQPRLVVLGARIGPPEVFD